MKKITHYSVTWIMIGMCLILIPDQAGAAESFSFFHSSVRMIWGLLIVLGILLIIYGLMRKKATLFQRHGNSAITVLETKHLMPKKTLFLVQVRGKEFLVGSGGESLSLLASFGPDEQTQARFEDILQESDPHQLS